jgi:type II secretion system protein N
MPERRIEPWKIAVGYAAFSVLAFLFFFYITFPYQALRERLEAEAAAQGYQIEMRGMGPGFFGVTARNVSLRRRATPGINTPAEPLQVESIAFRPSLFPLGLAFRASLLDGTITGSVGGVGDLDLDLKASDLDLSAGNMKAFSGLDLTGTLNGRFSLEVPRVTPPGQGQRAAEPDFGQASGSLVLDGEGVGINGGTLTVPMYGQPTPMDLPKITLGELNAKIVFDKGQGKVDALEAQSSDVDVRGSGTVKLARRLELTELNLELRFKPDPQFQKRLGMIGAGMAMLQVDRQDPQYRMARVTGYLGRPSFR